MKRIWFDAGRRNGRKLLWCAAVILLIAVLAALTGAVQTSLDRDAGMEFVKRMGNGINIGNCLDATGLYTWNPEAGELEFETSWGNPPVAQEMLRQLRQSGITTVRIPVSWNDHMDENGSISPLWLERVQQVVDDALEAELYVILNTHHEQWLDLSAGDTGAMERRLTSVWAQIAGRFAEYPEQLLFEGMNEPRAVGTPEEWLDGTETQREQINRLNQIFVDTVRGCGGKNRTRYLLITPYCSNPLEETVAALTVPDRRCIVSVHYYQPYLFCQQTDEAVAWDPNCVEDMEKVIERLSGAFLSQNVPVMVTEFGCVDRNNLEDRLLWTDAFISAANQRGIPCMWWDNGSSYRIIDRETGQWTCREIGELLTQAGTF